MCPAARFVLCLPSERPVDRLPRPRPPSVPFGQPDPALARTVVEMIRAATPPTVIPAHPALGARVRGFLHQLGVSP
jgi:hypothetical protein